MKEMISERDHKELLMLYEVTIEDIERAKVWMWRVASVALAGEGGVLGIYKLIPGGSIPGKVIFFFLIVAFVIIAWHNIQNALSSLTEFRGQVQNVRQHLGEKFNSCFKASSPRKEWLLQFVVAAGGLAAAFVLIFLLE